jgi:hypothetical protein
MHMHSVSGPVCLGTGRFPTFTSCRKYTKLQAQLVIPSTAISICVHVGLLMHAARHTAIIHTTRAQCVARHLPSLPLSVRKPRSARTPTRQPTLAISAPSWPRDSYRPVPIHRIPPAAARQPFRHRSRPLPISVVPPPPKPTRFPYRTVYARFTASPQTWLCPAKTEGRGHGTAERQERKRCQ